jgi:hypothetical protein
LALNKIIGGAHLELYHGSNVEVKNPKVRQNLRALDFGSGFYLTSSANAGVPDTNFV